MYIRFENTVIKHKYYNHICIGIFLNYSERVLMLNILLKFQIFLQIFKFKIFYFLKYNFIIIEQT